MSWVEHVACMAEGGNAYKTLIRKPEGKRLLRRQFVWLRTGSSGRVL